MSTVPLSGSFAATGQSAAVDIRGKANLLIEGGVGTVVLEKSFDGGATFHAVSRDSAGNNAAYTTADDVAFNGTVEEVQDGIKYRLNCTAFTSGPINYRLNQ